MEPEILTAIEDNDDKSKAKHIVLGIGFFFGPNGTQFQVFTPKGTWYGIATPPKLWLLAKMHALCADSQIHESLNHLGMGHMFGEIFAIAHHNAYNYLPNKNHSNKNKGNHVIGQMLKPHFTNLLAINTLARYTLVSEVNSTLDPFEGLRG